MKTARRPAAPQDLPLILRAERAYMTQVEPDQLDAWTAALDRNLALWVEHLGRTTVVESGGQAAAFVMWRPEADGAATLITIQVLPAYRRRGLGLELLEIFAGQAAAAGSRVLRLGVHVDNPARGIYPRAGYVETGRDGAYLLYERVL